MSVGPTSFGSIGPRTVRIFCTAPPLPASQRAGTLCSDGTILAHLRPGSACAASWRGAPRGLPPELSAAACACRARQAAPERHASTRDADGDDRREDHCAAGKLECRERLVEDRKRQEDRHERLDGRERGRVTRSDMAHPGPEQIIAMSVPMVITAAADHQPVASEVKVTPRVSATSASTTVGPSQTSGKRSNAETESRSIR